MVEAYVPDRGDLVWLNFNPSRGREQQGRRPAIVLTPKSYNRVSELAIFLPITSKRKGYPFEVALPKTLSIQGVVLVDQIKSLDWQNRDITFIEKASLETLDLIRLKIAPLIFET